MPQAPFQAESFEGKPVERLRTIALRNNRWTLFCCLLGMLILAVGYSVWTQPEPNPAPAARAAALDGRISSGPIAESNSPEVTSPPPAQAPGAATAPVSFTKSPLYPSALSVAGMEEGDNRAEAIEALMESWVAANPQQAADWAGSLPAGTFRDDALSALMVHWAARDPGGAAGWMSRTGVDDGEAASVLAGSWAATDPSAAAAWASSMENLESRRLAVSSAVSAWAHTAPQAAAAFAGRLPDNERASAITAVISTWAATAPAEAAAWLTHVSFGSPSDHAITLGALVTPWSAQNPGAVSKFINTLPEGPAREAAASQFAVTAAATAPAEALMWAMNLNDPDQRNQVTADACETWYDKSPETFRAGIEEAIGLMDDPAMRRSVYEMLYERDPDFQTQLLELVDKNALDKAVTPAPPATKPLQLPDASLLPPSGQDTPATDP
jgi:hypothetical protein